MYASRIREPSMGVMVVIIRSRHLQRLHYSDVMMSATASEVSIVYSAVFRRRSKKTSKLRDTCLCEGNSPVTGEFPAQRASVAANASIWWRHHFPVVSLSIPQSAVDTWWSVKVFRITGLMCAANPPAISPYKGPVMQRFGVFFVVNQNKLLDKQINSRVAGVSRRLNIHVTSLQCILGIMQPARTCLAFVGV